MQKPPPLPNAKPPDWWDRNWKWFVPAVCAVGLLLMGSFVAVIFGAMRSSDAYVGALGRSRASPAVVAALGTPIEPGFFVTGTINLTDSTGRAELAIPISGPKADATISVEATKALGVWHFNHLVVQIVQTGRRIDLSEAPQPP
jgi:Cytochrome oxidase complex assembly protein 1